MGWRRTKGKNLSRINLGKIINEEFNLPSIRDDNAATWTV